MAPPKTMTMVQQQQQQQQVKPRKRRAGGANQNQNQNQTQSSNKQQVLTANNNNNSNSNIADPAVMSTTAKAKPALVVENATEHLQNGHAKGAKQQAANVVVPSARSSTQNNHSNSNNNNNNNKSKQQVPSTIVKTDSSPLTTTQPPPSMNTNEKLVISSGNKPAAMATIGKHLSTDEPDDIDAGIELDGSSNSGSSVKDMGEPDQIKSASVSPVMSAGGASPKTTTTTTTADNNAEKKKATVASSTTTTTTTTTPATTTTTKQQLAANQEVIDADEELLQQKLQNKQLQKRSTPKEKSVTAAAAAANDQQKPSTTKSSSTSAAGSNNNNQSENNDNKQPVAQQQQQQTANSNNKLRRFSSQSSQEEQQPGSMCKVCGQHVYQMERMLAEKSIYHKRCFRCYQCKIQLRVDNYSSHEGQVYCKAHHRQLFQPQVKLDNDDDVDIVAKSRLRQRQMIICENEPKELPKDVVRSDTKLDDGFEQLNLNLGNLKERFERGIEQQEQGNSQPSSAGIVIEKPSFNIKQTLKAFESRLSSTGVLDSSSSSFGDSSSGPQAPPSVERPVVRKLTNLNALFSNNRNNSSQDGSQDSDGQKQSPTSAGKPLPMRRSESLMMRLKKYESRIAGEQVEDDSDEGDSDNNDNEKEKEKETNKLPKKLINLSSLKSQWENGDINNKRFDDDDDEDADNNDNKRSDGASLAAATIGAVRRHKLSGPFGGDTMSCSSTNSVVTTQTANTSVVSSEKEEELFRIRQQLAARKKNSSGGIKNIYEMAIKEAQQASTNSLKRDSLINSDLSTLNGIVKTTEIQQQLLMNQQSSFDSSSLEPKTPTTPNNSNKDHFHQLNFSNRANKLKEKFELGLINNSSHDSDLDSNCSDSEKKELSKLEQIRQEKMEDLSVFTDGEIKAREARSLFQQIDRRISAANGTSGAFNKNAANGNSSLASIGASMRAKLTSKMDSKSNNSQASNFNGNLNQSFAPINNNNHHNNNNNNYNSQNEIVEKQQPIRLTNNVRQQKTT